MNAYASHGGVDKRRFEMYALAASIIGKCHFCVKSHFETLVAEGMSSTQLRDVGRIAAVDQRRRAVHRRGREISGYARSAMSAAAR